VLLRGADAFAFASHYDPFALVIPEAMASGVPIITAPSVGASALIKHGENGFVIRESGDLQGMVTVLQQIANDSHLVSNIRRNARKTAEMMSWEAMALQCEAVYERIRAAKQCRDRGNAVVA